MAVLVATDFFTAEVWTTAGLMTYYARFFLHLASRKVHVAGMTPHHPPRWRVQIARSITMDTWGCLAPGQSLIHDSDDQYCPALQPVIAPAGVKRVPLLPRSPNVHADAERWVRSITDKVRSQGILCGEASLGHALTQDGEHFPHERKQQGKRNVLLCPSYSQDR
jgi:hypothetical protein